VIEHNLGRDQDRRLGGRPRPRGRRARRAASSRPGTPEQVARERGSYTGQFLQRVLGPAQGPAQGGGVSEGKQLIRGPVTVRWGDMDAFVHVNNATYATYVEEARLRWFQTIEGEWRNDEISPILAAQHINYRVPIEWPRR
jgi:acyl-CoA thioester hydrolase